MKKNTNQQIQFKLTEMGNISSVQDLIEGSAELCNRAEARLFYRGHSKSDFLLVPSIGRGISFGNKIDVRFTAEQERLILHRFRRHAYAHVGRLITEWEALLLARHHGLPTRLLDWALSPLVALFFACCDNAGMAGCVWGFSRFKESRHTRSTDIDIIEKILDPESSPLEPILAPSDETNQPDNKDSVRIIYPVANTPRIVVQGGVFTWHSNPTIPLDRYAGKCIQRSNWDLAHLYRWDIPEEKKNELLKCLDLCGVNRRTLYPDLDGIAMSLWQAEVLFRGDSTP